MKTKKIKKPNEYKTMIPYLYRYRFQYIAGFVILLIVDAAQVVIPQIIRRAVDIISGGDFVWQAILTLSLAMIGAMVIISSGRFLWRYFIHGSSRRIETEMRQALFDHLLTLSWDFYQKNKIGDLMARATNDIGAVRMAIGWGLVALVDGTVMALSILVIIFIQDARTAMFAVLPLPLITLVIVFFGRVIGKRFMKAQQTYSALSEAVQETFAGIRVIKSFVKEDYFIKKFADTNDDYRKANMAIVRIYGAFFPFVSFLAGLTSIIVIFAGGREVVLGRMSPGSLVALFSYLQMLIWPMLGMGFTVNMLQRGAVSLGRVNEVMRTEPSIKNSDAPVVVAAAASPTSGSPAFIELRSMSFAYETDKPVLHDISLSIEKGSVLGVTGRTGSGKSTLIKTLCRSIDPPVGTVFIRGADVRDWDLESLRKLFAMTPQDSYLFSASIKSNIAYGNDGADDAAIQKAIETAALNRDIEMFAGGLDTLIGERGLTLSGGQKQRTAIARSLLLDAEILVLDDSLSACDAETETKIIENVKSSRSGKTTIIVSHRISAFRYADNVAVLDNGRVAEYGPPALLSKQGGFYARMAALQAASLSEGGAL